MHSLRSQFPILKTSVHNKPLVYLDNAATNQKPLRVINAISNYYIQQNSNIHRGVHALSQQATESYEHVREQVKTFINAKHSHEIIFTRGTTEAINLVAYSFCKKFVSSGDEILISALEHHSNIVPWQMACEEQGATLKVLPMNLNGELMTEALPQLLSNKVKLVAIAHISNALGTVNPIKKIIDAAHQLGIPVLIDGAQAVAHTKVDVQALDCDFYCFSGHKMYGPMGIGVLYGKEQWLESMPPYQGGGEMIDEVTFKKTTYNVLPFKFEAGTPNVGDVIGLGEALRFISDTGISTIAETEEVLIKYCEEQLLAEGGITLVGTPEKKSGVVSFLIDNVHPYDAGTIIDRFGVAVRTGHHCAQPVMDFFGIPGTIRASFAVYNTKAEIDVLIKAIQQVKTMFC
ncbi:MAG: cysteine desulfurase [Bacteroidales bacterium]|nr:cysteine desulfurase [Bacteroidales bacterium]MDD2322946.1 cysteine desulfurase [Bacteroidales bacterium]MDD3011246.1 cysteine desulfurase [Bacteroidales bacterium]MDD3961917.1 cysteine desulfurase [Bacteroidales bacterium]MDY0285318.1 cysteine desulfurase [Bacteroidales bacterium]